MDNHSKDSSSLTPLQQMISSCAGAFITSLFVTPLDVVKIRIQAQQKEFMKNKCFLYCNGLMDHICYCNGNGNGNINNGNVDANITKQNSSIYQRSKWFKRPAQFRGTLDGIIQISREEGITSLWSGLPPTLIMALPATVIYFMVYEQIKSHMKLRLEVNNIPLWVPMFAGASARIFSAVTISPLEMVRTKMQSKKLSYREIGIAIKLLIKHEGILALYRGLAPTILRDVPFSAIYWGGYELVKRRMNYLEPEFLVNFLSGAVAGSFAALVTLPFDVVKTHRQIELGQDLISQKSSKDKLNSVSSIIKYIYRQRGLKGLFAGLSPRIIKVAPACAIMISTYECGKSFFLNYNHVKKERLNIM